MINNKIYNHDSIFNNFLEYGIKKSFLIEPTTFCNFDFRFNFLKIATNDLRLETDRKDHL